MSDDDLEVLITLDDPWYGLDEDIFDHQQAGSYWPDHSFPTREQHDQLEPFANFV